MMKNYMTTWALAKGKKPTGDAVAGGWGQWPQPHLPGHL
jgi:predicted Zn-dependent protease